MKMLIVAAMLLVGVVLTSADEEQKCKLLERVKVVRQWNHAYGEGQHRIDFVIEVFQDYFKQFPKARDLFVKDHRGDNIYSVEFQAQGHRVLGALGLLINTADEPETLKVILGKLKENTAILGTGEEYLESFQHALLETLPHHIGNHFDYDAWNHCLGVIFGAIKH